MDNFMLYSLTAGKKALQDGGITEDVMEELDKAKCGVLVGSAMGGMKVNSAVYNLYALIYKDEGCLERRQEPTHLYDIKLDANRT